MIANYSNDCKLFSLTLRYGRSNCQFVVFKMQKAPIHFKQIIESFLRLYMTTSRDLAQYFAFLKKFSRFINKNTLINILKVREQFLPAVWQQNI